MKWLLELLGLGELFNFSPTENMAHTFGIVPNDPTTKGWIAVIFLGLIVINFLNIKDVKKK